MNAQGVSTVARLEPPTLEQLTPEQKEIYDVVGRGRPKVTGPFSVLLRNAPLARAANDMTLALRENGKLGPRLFELIVLMVVRHWGAHYAWAVHEQPGIKAGLPADAVEAIRVGRKAVFKQADEQVIYDAVGELLATKTMSQANYDKLIKQFGVDLTIEIVAVAGFYGTISTVINVFEVPTPTGGKAF